MPGKDQGEEPNPTLEVAACNTILTTIGTGSVPKAHNFFEGMAGGKGHGVPTPDVVS